MTAFTPSRIVWGTMRLNDDPANPATPETILARIKACMALGITTFDLADIYGEYENEALFGKALALEPGLRTKMQLITKCGILYPNKNRYFFIDNMPSICLRRCWLRA
jgi:predicted oxidoreductase